MALPIVSILIGLFIPGIPAPPCGPSWGGAPVKADAGELGNASGLAAHAFAEGEGKAAEGEGNGEPMDIEGDEVPAEPKHKVESPKPKQHLHVQAHGATVHSADAAEEKSPRASHAVQSPKSGHSQNHEPAGAKN